jgi:hypothetical protein
MALHLRCKKCAHGSLTYRNGLSSITVSRPKVEFEMGTPEPAMKEGRIEKSRFCGGLEQSEMLCLEHHW